MICAVVLGAGESRRMGRAKLLMPYGNVTVIEHIVEELQSTEIDRIVVVLGCEPEPIRKCLDGYPVEVIENPTFADGMLSSVRCGIRALPTGARAVLFALGDQPAIASNLVDDMIYAFRGTEKGIVVPKYNGRRGHPLLISTRYCPEILREYDDTGLRGLLDVRWEDLFELPVLSDAILADMDTPEDYERELARRDRDQAKTAPRDA